MCARSSLAIIFVAACAGVPAASQMSSGPAMKMDHSHRFVLSPGGGQILMQRASEDAARVADIRRHIEDIARLFAAGDFRLPPGVDRSQEVPGTRTMTERLAQITVVAKRLPRGAEVVISSRDPKAVEAIHAFLEFHRTEHQAMEPSKR
jgi:hypothetical protein